MNLLRAGSVIQTRLGSDSLTPEISVVLPVYNHAGELRECLEGFTKQTIAPSRFEIVIVDDGSTPPLLETVRAFKDRLNISYCLQDRSGKAYARNTAILNSCAANLALFSATSIPSENYLKRCLEFHLKNPREEDILIGLNSVSPEDQGNVVSKSLVEQIGAFWSASSTKDGQFGWAFPGNNASCKRSIFRFGLYSPVFESIIEDIELSYRINQNLPLRCVFDNELISFASSSLSFAEEFKRTYLEGRAQYQLYSLYGEAVGRYLPADIPSLPNFCQNVVSQISSALGTISSLGAPGRKASEKDSFMFAGQTFVGNDAPWAACVIALRYARARGWLDEEQRQDVNSGMEAVEKLLSEHYSQPLAVKPAQEHSFPFRTAAHSKSRVDVVLQATGLHSWNVGGGWINALKELGVLNRVFEPKAKWGDAEPSNDDGLLQYLKKPEADFILLLGFDWHSQALHTAKQWMDAWAQCPMQKILYCQEAIAARDRVYDTNLSSETFFHTQDLVNSCIVTTEEDAPLAEIRCKKVLWQPFGVDHTVFQKRTDWPFRQDKAFFRGKSHQFFNRSAYCIRRLLMQIVSLGGLTDVLPYVESEVAAEEIAQQYNQYTNALSLPTICDSAHPARVFEAMACGCCVITNLTSSPRANSLFQDGKEVLYYESANPQRLPLLLEECVKKKDEAQQVAENARQKVLEQHTLIERCKEMLKWQGIGW